MMLAELFGTDDLWKLAGVAAALVGVYVKLRVDIKSNTDAIAASRKDIHDIRGTIQSDRHLGETEQAEFRKLSEVVTGALSEIKADMRNFASENNRTWTRVDGQSNKVSEIDRKLATLEARADIAFMVRQNDKHEG